MLKRDLSRLSRRPFDCLIIGGNTLATLLAWDATMRGLRVAIVAPEDFGVASSAVGLSLMQASFRFFEGVGWRQCRRLNQERQAFLRIAPHLARPLPMLLLNNQPDWRWTRPFLATAVKLNQLITYDHNFSLDPARTLQYGHVLSHRELMAQHAPLAKKRPLSNGIKFEEAQLVAPNRLLLAILRSTCEAGAVAANYVKVKQLRQHRGRVVGANVIDSLSQQEFEIGAKWIINTTPSGLATVDGYDFPQPIQPKHCRYLLTRQLFADKGLRFMRPEALPFSIVPWHDASLIGPFVDDNTAVQKLLDYVNQCYPAGQLTMIDVYRQVSHEPTDFVPGVNVSHHLIDHAKQDGTHGLFSVRGGGFDMDRYLAEQVVNILFETFKRPSPTCRTKHNRVAGGQITHWDTFEMASLEHWPVEMPPAQIRRYLASYGTNHTELFDIMAESLAYCQPVGEETAVTQAEVLYAVRNEMAMKLGDVVLRRTEMGSTRPPTVEALQHTATLMANERQWSKEQMRQEVDELLASMDMMF